MEDLPGLPYPSSHRDSSCMDYFALRIRLLGCAELSQRGPQTAGGTRADLSLVPNFRPRWKNALNPIAMKLYDTGRHGP